MMKKILLTIVVFSISIVSLGAQNQARITETTGKVEVRLNGGPWQTAEIGMTITTGAYISTGFSSSATLDLGASLIQVKPLTRMQLQEFIEQEGTVSTELFLRVGKVRAEVKSVEGLSQDFKLRSPVSTAAVRGTIFERDIYGVEVAEGRVKLSNLYQQTRTVKGGESSNTGGKDLPPGGREGRDAGIDVPVVTSPTGSNSRINPGAPTPDTTVILVWVF
jgi:hypothetical protein